MTKLKSKIEIIEKDCPICGKSNSVKVDKEAHQKWVEGELIQNAFPNISPEDREILKTGICPICWNTLFKTK